jgi:energy-coupling factor transporter ATP-binding protein EcfA2
MPWVTLMKPEVLIIVTHDIEAIRKRARERIAMDIGFHFFLVNRNRAFARDEMAEVVVGDERSPEPQRA